MLSLYDLKVSRNHKTLFSSLSFTLDIGSILIISGANGCGKTTLLKVIAGLITPEKGTIFWEGIDIRSHLEVFHRNIIYIGHSTALNQELTILQNLTFWASLRQNLEMVEPALHYFQLIDKATSLISHLSAGWQRRAALARLMLDNTALWLLDEPFTHLDEEGKSLVNTLISSRIQQGGMVVLTSHYPLTLPSSCLLYLPDFYSPSP